MPTAGYSGTPLPGKLGIKPDHRVLVLRAPLDFKATLGHLPPGVRLTTSRREQPFDIVIHFVTTARQLKELKRLKRLLVSKGGLWAAWPKKASGVKTDVTEDVIRAAGIQAGLIDNKVCAIDATWSGLRLVIPLQAREQ
jgi:hypothetical protein